MKVLTPQDVIDAGGAVTDEQLEPFVSGDTDSDRDFSRRKLRRAVNGCMSHFSKLTPSGKAREKDQPIITVTESVSKPTKKSTAKTRPARKRGKK